MISVLLCAFNSETTLEVAVHSILNQTITDLELILCDDGSIDGTLSLMRAFEKRDSRVKVISNNENLGLPASLNRCIEIAKGEFIARMDADDQSLPQRLEKELTYLTENNLDYVGCGAKLVWKGEIWGERFYPQLITSAAVLKRNVLIHPTLLIKTDILRKLKYEVLDTYRCEDYDLLFRLCALGFDGANLQEPLLLFSENPGEYRKHNLKSRISEFKTRLRGNKWLKGGLKGLIYAFYPLLLSLVPGFIYKALQPKKWKKNSSKGNRE